MKCSLNKRSFLYSHQASLYLQTRVPKKTYNKPYRKDSFSQQERDQERQEQYQSSRQRRLPLSLVFVTSHLFHPSILFPPRASPLFCLLSHLHLSAAVTRHLSHTSDMTSLSSPSLKLLPSPLPLSSRSLPYPPAMFPAKPPLYIEPYPSRIPPSYSHGLSLSGTGGQHQPTTYFTLSHPTPRSSRFPLVSVRGGR